ncbi:MAG: hypothetical protein MJZ78_04030 [Bacteroidales bacterium]|nr:hypothetical protein [Bacteroidales bacterium]
MDLKPVKQSLERMSCPIHGSHPEVAVLRDKLEIKCCCEAFKAKLIERQRQLVAEQAKKEIENQLKKMFK